DDLARKYLVHDRELAYNEGLNCRWLCPCCWQRHLEDNGVLEAPLGKSMAERLASNQKDRKAENEVKVSNDSDNTLSQLLLTATSSDGPGQIGSAIPRERPIDNRSGTGAMKSGSYSATCGSCVGEPVKYTWKPSQPAPGPFIWKPNADWDATDDRCGLSECETWVERWAGASWNEHWQCRICLVHIWDIEPSASNVALDRHSARTRPPAPTKRAPGPRPIADNSLRDEFGHPRGFGMGGDATPPWLLCPDQLDTSRCDHILSIPPSFSPPARPPLSHREVDAYLAAASDQVGAETASPLTQARHVRCLDPACDDAWIALSSREGPEPDDLSDGAFGRRLACTYIVSLCAGTPTDD
ncbi:unnamed protein product, partial [Prorocentrum cordatum]